MVNSITRLRYCKASESLSPLSKLNACTVYQLVFIRHWFNTKYQVRHRWLIFLNVWWVSSIYQTELQSWAMEKFLSKLIVCYCAAIAAERKQCHPGRRWIIIKEVNNSQVSGCPWTEQESQGLSFPSIIKTVRLAMERGDSDVVRGLQVIIENSQNPSFMSYHCPPDWSGIFSNVAAVGPPTLLKLTLIHNPVRHPQ